jgi:hypothetical protein
MSFNLVCFLFSQQCLEAHVKNVVLAQTEEGLLHWTNEGREDGTTKRLADIENLLFDDLLFCLTTSANKKGKITFLN